MTGSRAAHIARSSVVLYVIAALLFGLPSFALAAGLNGEDPTPPTPITEPPAPTPPTPSATAPTRPPADPSVIGDAGVDQVTEEFRRKLQARQAELDAFMAQLDELDRELAIAAEAYNQARDRLESMKTQVVESETTLEELQKTYDQQRGLLDNQVGTIYRSGTYSPVEVLLDAKSLSDFLARVKFLNTVGTNSADVVRELSASKADLEKKVFELKNAKQLAEALEFELKARQIEVQLRIQERQEMFGAAQAGLIELLDYEAARRQRDEAALLKEVLAGATKAGIRVEPGSPVETALAYHGVPYLWGGDSPSGFDCSGLVLYVFAQHGVRLPHYSGSQFLLGTKVTPAELQPGDVVFFGSPIHHVGMYMGGGYYIHAPRTGDFVKISRLADRSDFAGARRYAWTTRLIPPLSGLRTPAAALSTVE